MTRVDVERLTVRKDSATLLDDVSFSASGGEFIAVAGPNGAGKSTLLRAIAGIEPLQSGRVAFDDVDVASIRTAARARLFAYLPQAREVHWAITADSVVSLGRFAYGAPHCLGADDRVAVDRAFVVADVSALRTRIMTTLSGGEQARVHLARTLAAETPALFVDEPTAALDLQHALSIAGILRAKSDAGGLVIAAMHDLDLARRFASRMIVIDEGRIVADGAPQNAMTGGLMRRVFGIKMGMSGLSFEPLDADHA